MLNTLNIKNRIFGLDLLRALAILFVMWGHGTTLLQKENLDSWIYYLAIDGLSIFFVLSGFLIGGIWIKLVAQSAVGISLILNFWIRRWFRTLPNYYLILTVLVVLSATYRDFNINEALPYYGFVQNLNWVHPLFFAEAWSLSIEEWFYFLLPLLYITLSFFRGLSVRKKMLYLILVVILFSSVWRYVRAIDLGEVDFFIWNDQFRSQVFMRLDSIMYGVLGAYVAFYFPKSWLRFRKPAILIGAFTLGFNQFMVVNNFLTESSFGLYYQLFSFSVVSIRESLFIAVSV